LQTERREAQKQEDIEELKKRLESDKVWAGNEVEKLRIKKEQEMALSAVHLEQAVRCFDLIHDLPFLPISAIESRVS